MTESHETGPAPAGWSGRLRVLGGIGTIVLLGVAAVVWYYSGRESTDDAQIDGHITQVAVRVGGTVARVAVEDNQAVEAGDVLVEVDARDYQVAVDRAKAELADAQAAARAANSGVPIATAMTSSDVATASGGLTQARAGVAAADAEIESARARLVAAKARLKERQADSAKQARDVERLKPLADKEAIPQQHYDAVVAAAAVAAAAVEGAGSEVHAAETAVGVAERRAEQARAALAQADAAVTAARTAPEQVDVSRARAAAAEARVLQAKAALAQAQLNLERTTIKAPTSGVVSRRAVEPGQVVQPGQPLLALVGLDDVWVTANFKETQIASIRPGLPVTISVDALGGRTLRGRVDSIAPATGARFSLLPPDNATGNYVKVVQRVPVKIVFEDGQTPDRVLRPGLSVTPTVLTR